MEGKKCGRGRGEGGFTACIPFWFTFIVCCTYLRRLVILPNAWCNTKKSIFFGWFHLYTRWMGTYFASCITRFKRYTKHWTCEIPIFTHPFGGPHQKSGLSQKTEFLRIGAHCVSPTIIYYWNIETLLVLSKKGLIFLLAISSSLSPAYVSTTKSGT